MLIIGCDYHPGFQPAPIHFGNTWRRGYKGFAEKRQITVPGDRRHTFLFGFAG